MITHNIKLVVYVQRELIVFQENCPILRHWMCARVSILRYTRFIDQHRVFPKTEVRRVRIQNVVTMAGN